MGAAFVFLSTSSGCTALRELPRGEYAAQVERKNVRIETAEGLRYEFDYARFGEDTLTGFKRREIEASRFEEFDAVALPLERVSKLSVRRIDWMRTGVIGGAALGVVLVQALRGGDEETAPPVDPCPRCPD